MTLLCAKNLRKTFSSPEQIEVLKGISLDIQEEEIVAITGKSGEGKTTLLHLLGTLELPTSGAIYFRGQECLPACFSNLRCHHFGFIFQAYNLLDEFTVLENVLMPARVARMSTKEGSPAYKRASELLSQVGLSHRIHFLAKVLSGGEKQRVAIARALCNDPAIVFADEPSGSLDHTHSESIHELLIKTVKTNKKALVVVTHDSELASLCDRRFHLKEGLLTWNS